jgi:hypothetical protein
MPSLQPMRTHDQPPAARSPPVFGSHADAASSSNDEAPELFMGAFCVDFAALENIGCICFLHIFCIDVDVGLCVHSNWYQMCFADNIFTLDVMEEPVIATDGFTYEKRSSVCLLVPC